MLTSIAHVFAATGHAEDAARVLGAADAFCASVGIVADLEGLFPMRPGAIDLARAALGDERFAELRAEGAAMARDETVAWLVRGRGRRKRPSSGWESLTPTERQVVELVAEGLANKEIAGRLFVSVPTVKSHLTHVFVKTGLTTRAQVAAEWVRRSPGGGSDS
jgi:DNA-binding CsgD family transcriptional regulator